MLSSHDRFYCIQGKQMCSLASQQSEGPQTNGVTFAQQVPPESQSVPAGHANSSSFPASVTSASMVVASGPGGRSILSKTVESVTPLPSALWTPPSRAPPVPASRRLIACPPQPRCMARTMEGERFRMRGRVVPSGVASTHKGLASHAHADIAGRAVKQEFIAAPRHQG